MPFAVKDLPFAKDALDGISAQTIETHHDKLYPGYVNKRNEIEAALPNADRSKSAQTYSEYRALKHEETFNADGQILHELYFSHLGGNGTPPTGPWRSRSTATSAPSTTSSPSSGRGDGRPRVGQRGPRPHGQQAARLYRGRPQPGGGLGHHPHHDP